MSRASNIPAGYALVSGEAYGQRYHSLVAPDGKIIENAYEQGAPAMFVFLSALAAPPVDAVPGEPVALDGCELCNGQRGGVPGNENLIDGKRVCDYCHSLATPTASRAVVAEPGELQLVGYIGSQGEILASTHYRGKPLEQGTKVYALSDATSIPAFRCACKTCGRPTSGAFAVWADVPVCCCTLDAPTAPAAAAEPSDDLGTMIAKEMFARRWDEAAQRKCDQAVTPEFLTWLQEVAYREGVAANVAWNAGVAWARATPSSPLVEQAEPSDQQCAAQLSIMKTPPMEDGAAMHDWACDVMRAGFRLADRAGVAALVASEDTKRLDWIESKVCDVSRLGDMARTVRISWNNGADSVFVGPGYSATWREAIDRAGAGEAQS